MLKFATNKCYLDVKDHKGMQEQLDYIIGMEVLYTDIYLDRTLQTLSETIKKASIIVPFNIEILAKTMDLFFWGANLEELHNVLNDYIDAHELAEAVALEISKEYEKTINTEKEPEWVRMAFLLGTGQLLLRKRYFESLEFEMLMA